MLLRRPAQGSHLRREGADREGPHADLGGGKGWQRAASLAEGLFGVLRAIGELGCLVQETLGGVQRGNGFASGSVLWSSAHTPLLAAYALPDAEGVPACSSCEGLLQPVSKLTRSSQTTRARVPVQSVP